MLASLCPSSAARICRTCTNMPRSTGRCRRCQPGWRKRRNRYVFTFAARPLLDLFGRVFMSTGAAVPACASLCKMAAISALSCTRRLSTNTQCSDPVPPRAPSWEHDDSIFYSRARLCSLVSPESALDGTKESRDFSPLHHFVDFLCGGGGGAGAGLSPAGPSASGGQGETLSPPRPLWQLGVACWQLRLRHVCGAPAALREPGQRVPNQPFI